jgi:hypothetical protein
MLVFTCPILLVLAGATYIVRLLWHSFDSHPNARFAMSIVYALVIVVLLYLLVFITSIKFD